ncbi:chaperonin 10-like protein [Cryomyces antarcticus]
MAPQSNKQWTVNGTSGFDALKFNENAPVPKLGDKDVLVRFHGASLNYRDLIIPKGQYPFPQRDGVVPASDGSGTVEEVGGQVTRFKKGDEVVTLFNQGHLGGSLNPTINETGVGGVIDGTLQQYGKFDEQGLVKKPKNLDFLEASTLSCAGLTAWNGLYGLESRALKQGDWVLTQGTGGVSIFAIQVVRKIRRCNRHRYDLLRSQSRNPQEARRRPRHQLQDTNWGETARKLTPDQLGVHHILEVGGPTTMAQSLKAIKIDGVISIIGFLGGVKGEQPTFLDCLTNICTVRGLLVGSRLMFEDMNRAVEANNIKPVVDEKVFSLEEVREAYEYMWAQKHFGKLCIRID